MIIKFKGVGEKFRLYRRGEEPFWALRDINFEIGQGECIGVIGENGSGKTTLLNLIAGILTPDEGEIKVHGRVAALLELGVGFQPNLSGRENIYLYGAVLGIDKKVIDARFDEIVRFSELERFIDAPVRTYSAGMYVRLGFAVAINIDADIILIDEVLAVGDESYRLKCIERIMELKKAGKTIIFVSHDVALVEQICNRVIFLKDGRIVCDDAAEIGVNLYLDYVREKRKSLYLYYIREKEKRKKIAILNNPMLDLSLKEGKMTLSWDGRELTKVWGLYTLFLYDDVWIGSHAAQWDIEKRDDGIVFIHLKWAAIGAEQTWCIKFEADGSIGWDVLMKTEEPNRITQSQMGILLTEGYEGWAYGQRKGKFPKITPQDDVWREVTAKDGLARFAAVDRISKGDGVLPMVILDISDNKEGDFVLIGNTEYKTGARVLRSLNASAGKMLSGKKFTLIGTAKIMVDPNDNLIENRLNNFALSRSINKNGVKIVFENGNVRLFHNDAELTTNFGIYTSLKSNGLWHDSASTRWELKKLNDAKATALVKWLRLPVSQMWEIEILEDSRIKLDVIMEIHDDVEIEREQANIMLKEDYIKWHVHGGPGGDFPEFNEDYGGDWHSLWSGIPSAGLIAVSSLRNAHDLPPVTLECSSREEGDRLNIINSDNLFRGRVLQCLRERKGNNTRLLPGRYKYFTGLIGISKEIAETE